MILVGTSGFSFDDWQGVFYPPTVRKSDRFAWYIRHFSTVEINSTYYRIPPPSVFHKMDTISPDNYTFHVKVHADVTHKRKDPGFSTDRLLEAVEPIRSSGKLAGVLAQFPYAFHDTPENRKYISTIRSLHPPEIRLFVEFRHSDWDRPETYRFLGDEGIGYCSVDEPQLKGLLPPDSRETNGTGYVRFHGRNEKNWWGGEGDRYDYLYTDEELQEWVDKIRDLERVTERTFVFFNNCHAGQAVRGAKRLQSMLGIPLMGEEWERLL